MHLWRSMRRNSPYEWKYQSILYVSLCSSYIKNELKETVKELRKYRFEFARLDRKPDDWRCFYDNAVKSDGSFRPARNILYSGL